MTQELELMRNEIIKTRDDMILKHGLSLDAAEYSAVTVNLATQMKRLLLLFNHDQVTMEALDFLNVSLPYTVPVKLMEPDHCHWDQDRKRLTLDFIGKLISDHQSALRVDPFTLYEEHGTDICKVEYHGPEYAIFDSQSNAPCKLAAVPHKDSYMESRTRQCRPVVKVWIFTACSPTISFAHADTVQIKELDNNILIYCFLNQIQVTEDSPLIDCPPEVIFLPLNASFHVAGMERPFRAHATRFPQSPGQLDIWQHAVNAHMKPDSDPYRRINNMKEIETRLEHAKEMTKTHWIYGSLSVVLGLIIAFTFATFCFLVYGQRQRDQLAQRLRTQDSQRRVWRQHYDIDGLEMAVPVVSKVGKSKVSKLQASKVRINKSRASNIDSGSVTSRSMSVPFVVHAPASV